MEKIDEKFDRFETLSLARDFLSWSNEIPKEIIHSGEIINGEVIVPKYKVRKGWFAAIYSLVDCGLSCGYFSPKIGRNYLSLQDYINKTKFRRRLTTKEDIKKADNLLKLVLDEAGVVY